MTHPTEFRRLHLRIPVSLGDQLNSIAWKNRRSMTAEIILALEKHISEEIKKAPDQPASNPGASTTTV